MRKSYINLLVIFLVFILCITMSSATVAAKTPRWKVTTTWTESNELIELDKNFLKRNEDKL